MAPIATPNAKIA